jgi:hypothetical protein
MPQGGSVLARQDWPPVWVCLIVRNRAQFATGCRNGFAGLERALLHRRKYNRRGARRRASLESSICSDPFLSRRNHGDSFSQALAAWV